MVANNSPSKQHKSILKPLFIIIIYLLIGLIVIDIGGQIAWRFKYGEWYFSKFHSAFIAHPYLVGVPRPNYYTQMPSKLKKITIKHNSLGYRGKEVSQEKKWGIKRICLLGGSTTYCVGTSNDETWPYFLENLLGPYWEVINMGVPGYSTVENIIQTSLNLSDFSPNYAIYYLGWNDVRNIHVKNLKSDYSDFHGKSQYGNLNIGQFNPYKWSLISLLARRGLSKLGFLEFGFHLEPTDKAFTTEIDPHALNLYERNILSIIALCKEQNIIPIFVPQVLNYDYLIDNEHFGSWVPFLKGKDLKTIMTIYNQSLKQIAEKENVGFVGEVLKINFDPSDFLDSGHFSPPGNRKFANNIKNYILSYQH